MRFDPAVAIPLDAPDGALKRCNFGFELGDAPE